MNIHAARTRNPSVQTLRRRARKLGFELVCPWGFDSRNIGADGWVLVPHHSGMCLEEVAGRLARLDASTPSALAH